MRNVYRILTLILVVLSPATIEASLTAPETASVGSLVGIKSDVPATVWTIQPAANAVNMYIDSNGKTAVFTSPTPGTVYVFAAYEQDGQLKSDVARVRIVEGYTPEPFDPTPNPPISPLADRVDREVDKLDGDTKPAEIEAFLDVLRSTVKFLDNGQISSTAGIRETLRRNWQVQAATISPQSVTRWDSVWNVLFDGLDKTDPTKAKEQIEAVLREMEGRE